MLTADGLRAVFDSTEPFTVGLEEEVMLLGPSSPGPVPIAEEILRSTASSPHLKPELPAAQVELCSEPRPELDAALADLREARLDLVRACEGRARPVAAAVHPDCAESCVLRSDDRSRALQHRYPSIAEQQLVGALQVHVALADADRTLAVYNSLRNHLPEIAALAAAAPLHRGRDTGLSSVRPLISGLLPRQGVPPVISSWQSLADDLNWGAVSATVGDAGQWWWELRPHVGYGTLEVRVPDVQPTMAATGAVASVVVALIRSLAARFDDGVELWPAPSWRIAENRWSALRDGVTGELADLVSGESRPTRTRLHCLLDRIEPHADGALDGARALVERNSAMELRDAGPAAAIDWLVEVFAS